MLAAAVAFITLPVRAVFGDRQAIHPDMPPEKIFWIGGTKRTEDSPSHGSFDKPFATLRYALNEARKYREMTGRTPMLVTLPTEEYRFVVRGQERSEDE